MATTPNQTEINGSSYTLIVNNLTEYLVQNVSTKSIHVVGSDVSTLPDVSTRGYILSPNECIRNADLKNYPYVFVKLSSSGIGYVMV